MRVCPKHDSSQLEKIKTFTNTKLVPGATLLTWCGECDWFYWAYKPLNQEEDRKVE